MSPVIKKLVNQLTADKKKLSIMLALVMVGMLLWGRLLLKQVPRTAVANPSESLSAQTDKVIEEAREIARKTINIDLPSALSRDVFTLNPAGYARIEKVEATVTQVGKSDPKPADESEQVSVTVLRAAKGLVLQTTMLGENPRAMINGQVLKPGEKIRGFELKQVNSRDVILEMEGIEVRLEM
ncbi:MAG: hypothetical protein IT444_01370 [Phycisphaeraceae bacterium]|nr:hypothetical protein [Phycisphaeraceae bacterium]